MKKVAIIAYEACWAMSVYLAKDFFRIVSLLEQHQNHPESYDVKILSNDGASVCSSSGSVIVPEGYLDKSKYDVVIIPPIEGIQLSNMPLSSQVIINWLSFQMKYSPIILSLSTATYFLAASGNCDDKQWATHWAFAKQLKKLFPNSKFATGKPYIRNDNIYTTSTFEAGIDVLLAIVARDKGDRFSQKCATHLLVSEPHKLSPILPQYLEHDDLNVLAVQDWIMLNYSQNIKIIDLANRFNFSERNLKRRFSLAVGTSINKYIQEVRLDKAKKLLLATNKSVKEISLEVGYENDSFFTRLFNKSTGTTPSNWRQIV